MLCAGCLVISGLVIAQDSSPPQDSEGGPMTPRYFYTYQQPDGNRLAAGRGSFPDVQVLDWPLDEPPLWVVGVPGEEPAWFVVLRSGGVRLVGLRDGALVSLNVAPLAFGQPSPPLVWRDHQGDVVGLDALVAGGSELTHAVPVFSSGKRTRFLSLTRSGELVLLDENRAELSKLPLDALPDARIVINDDRHAALYADATAERYVHGIMGDDLEAASVVVADIVGDALRLRAMIMLEGDEVFEGLAPIWADVNGDGTQDLITTVSSGDNGSRIRVYFYNGDGFTHEADGLPIGQGNRWQHQLAWGAFGPGGEMELVDVRTPHIGGIVRFHRFTGDRLEIAAELPGYTSHIIGSRNLDMAVAGDFNGDGQLEIVLPSQDRTNVAGIHHTGQGAGVAWSLPADGRVITNLAPAALPGGALALAVGTEDRRLRIWVSRTNP